MINVKTIREMIQEEATAKFDVGTVIAADVRGDRVVGVRLSGTGVVTRAMTCVEGLQAGDQVLVVHIRRLDRMVAVAQILDEHEGGLSRRGQLSPPNNLTYTPIPAGVEVRWDAWPGEVLSYQVRYNSSASDTGATDVLITRGSNYSHWTVDASGDMDTAATTYFRVRAVRWLGDSNIMFSAWSAWSAAQTSGGHNLRELIEVEFENAAELTLDAVGAIARTQVYHTIDTFGGAATDNLDTINGGTEGDLLIIRPESGARTIVVRHNQDNIWLLGASDITLDDANDHLMLIYDGSMWCDASGGGGGGGHTTFISHTDTPAAYAGAANYLTAVDPTESFLQWIAAAGWLSISDISDLSWQPDNVAILHNGRIYEYPDPDDAFSNAVGGDAILVPPGTWTLTSAHVLAANASVYGMGPRTDCILSSTTAGVMLRLAAGSGEIAHLTINHTSNAAAGTTAGLAIGAGCTARNLIVDHENLNTDPLSGCDAIQALGTATIIDCRALSENHGGNICAGIATQGATRIENCYAYAYHNNTADYSAGIYTGDSAIIRWTETIGTGAGPDESRYYGVYGYGPYTITHSIATGGDYDLYVDGSYMASLYSVQYGGKGKLEGNNFVHLYGDRPGAATATETIEGDWTFELPITLQESKLAPGGPGAGYGSLYCLDDVGQTRFFLMDDNAKIWMIAGVADGVTVTVNSGGGADYTTIQGAIDFFASWIVMGACIIEVASDTSYDEQINFDGVMIAPGSSLTLSGDTRVLAGMSYVDGVLIDRFALWANSGSGTCALANAGNNITVTGTTGNPDFDADGWASGDRILVKDNANAITEETISSVLNNVITLTGAAPAVGNNESAIALVPNRAIELTAAGTCITVSSLAGVRVYGFYLQSSTGASCNGLVSQEGASVKYRNLLAYVEDYCIYATGAGSQIGYLSYTPTSAWTANTATLMVIANSAAAISCSTIMVVGPDSATGTTAGLFTQHMGTIWAVAADVSGCDKGVWATWQSEIFASSVQARFNDKGFMSEANSMAVCTSTMATVVSTTTDYTPNPGGAGQFAESATDYGVLYKS